ncbi:MAG: FtsX-like permease family protein [Bacteroidetes bacterium]|nr:FtsX-like permease family protein [Bacteroidota bacterium]
MNWPLRIARRYLFARKSTNAINIITGISILGITIGTAALILVLSVFNGFEDLITGLFSNFNPDIKVVPAKGKTFEPDSIQLSEIWKLEGVETVSQTLEEVAFFEYENSQDFGILKGVDQYFNQVTGIDSTVREGRYAFRDDGRDFAVLGVGMRNKLSVNLGKVLSTVSVYMPKQKRVGPLENQFRKKFVYPAGTFVIQQDFDNQYVLVSLDFARSLMSMPNMVSSLEIKIKPGASEHRVQAGVEAIMGPEFLVRNRYQQDEAFLKLMNIEKWMSYAILSLTLLLVAFNMIGALWMIVLEKQKDISILKSMGATDKGVRNIFLSQGLLLCFVGMVLGYLVAVGLYLIHVNLPNGLVSIPQGFVVTAYPISLRSVDFFVIAITVISIGFLASWLPARRAMRVPAIIREE